MVDWAEYQNIGVQREMIEFAAMTYMLDWSYQKIHTKASSKHQNRET